MANQRERKFSSHHRQGLEQIFFLRRQPIDTGGEHPLYSGRNF